MYNFGDILTVNTRQVKKLVKRMAGNYGAKDKTVSESANSIAESYRGRFVVMEEREGQLVVIQHTPENPDTHQRLRNVPTSLVRRIRKGNPEHAKLLEVE